MGVNVEPPVLASMTLANGETVYVELSSDGQRRMREGTIVELINSDCTAPGFLDTRLRYAAWRSSYSSRASLGVRYASFSRRQHWL